MKDLSQIFKNPEESGEPVSATQFSSGLALSFGEKKCTATSAGRNGSSKRMPRDAVTSRVSKKSP
jgi:hypothetical protein